MRVEVRNNNVDQALRVLKRKLRNEGMFEELRHRRHYEKPSDRKRRERAAGVKRQQKARATQDS